MPRALHFLGNKGVMGCGIRVTRCGREAKPASYKFENIGCQELGLLEIRRVEYLFFHVLPVRLPDFQDSNFIVS